MQERLPIPHVTRRLLAPHFPSSLVINFAYYINLNLASLSEFGVSSQCRQDPLDCAPWYKLHRMGGRGCSRGAYPLGPVFSHRLESVDNSPHYTRIVISSNRGRQDGVWIKRAQVFRKCEPASSEATLLVPVPKASVQCQILVQASACTRRGV